MEKEMISIIVPVYNIESYIRRCVTSIQKQTHKNIEIILVNDGSTDGSKNLCNDLSHGDSRIVVLHKRNGGLASARNHGLQHASGEYIGFVDGDDYIEPEMYEHLIVEMKDDVGVTTCNVREEFPFQYIRKTDNRYSKTETVKMDQQRAIKELLLLRKINVSVCNKLFRRSVFDQVYFPEGKSSEDVPVIWGIIKNCRNVVNNGYYDYHYAHRTDSITMGEFSKGRLDGWHFTKKISDDVKRNYPQYYEEAVTLNAKFIHSYIDQILRSKNAVEYKKTFSELQEELKACEETIKQTEYLDDSFRRIMLQATHESFEQQMDRYIQNTEANKRQVFYELLLKWNENHILGTKITDILRDMRIRNIAIYGMKELGELLYEELAQSEISVDYVIDRRKKEILIDIPVYEPTDDLPNIDAVIVTAITYFDEIKGNLQTKIDSRIVDLKDLVFA